MSDNVIEFPGAKKAPKPKRSPSPERKEQPPVAENEVDISVKVAYAHLSKAFEAGTVTGLICMVRDRDNELQVFNAGFNIIEAFGAAELLKEAIRADSGPLIDDTFDVGDA